MNLPLVTVVLVCWNHERFVRASILGAVQSYVATYTFYLAITVCLVFVITRKMERDTPLPE